MKRINYSIFKYLNFIIVSAAVLMTLSGCIEEYEADISSEDSDLLVVEGTICSGRLNKFTLSRTQAINSFHKPQMVTRAMVSVRGSDGSEYFTREHKGEYTCRIDTLFPEVNYYLHIEVDGEVYESSPQKPLQTEKIEDVTGVQNTLISNIDILVTPEVPLDSSQVYYYSWTYDETWEVHPDYMTFIFFDPDSMGYRRNANQFPQRGWMDATGSTIMVGASIGYDKQHIQKLKLYDIDRSSERVYYKYGGLIHQRAISKAEYEYELARRQAASEMGGLFTPLPSALPTNIRCLTSKKHVLGFVGCSLNTSEYRFFLNATDFSVYHPTKIVSLLWIDDTSIDDCIRLVNNNMYLCEWEDNRMMPGGKLRTAWADEYQLNVKIRYKGAYTEEPYFWSQDPGPIN